jgi:signal transduction histidine kinase
VIRYLGRPAQTKEHLALVERSGRHLLQMVDGILDFSTIDANAMKLRVVSVDVARLVQEALETVSELATRAGVVLESELVDGAPAPSLHADPLRLKQVLINLLGNAIKFSNGRGPVTVRVASEDESVLFSVRDCGIGIAPEDRQKIFERFEQVDQGDTRKYGGTGLGLSISRSLVEMHEGEIWVESGLGLGSTFHFRLPKAGPRRAPGRSSQPSRVAGRSFAPRSAASAPQPLASIEPKQLTP